MTVTVPIVELRNPDAVFYAVVTRRRGGDHRGGKGVVVPRPRRDPSRAATGDEGALVDACDAAQLLGEHQVFWDALQILRHPEIARLAHAEAVAAERAGSRWQTLTADMSDAFSRRRASRDQVAALDAALEAIVRAHRDGLLVASA